MYHMLTSPFQDTQLGKQFTQISLQGKKGVNEKITILEYVTTITLKMKKSKFNYAKRTTEVSSPLVDKSLLYLNV